MSLVNQNRVIATLLLFKPHLEHFASSKVVSIGVNGAVIPVKAELPLGKIMVSLTYFEGNVVRDIVSNVLKINLF